MRKLMGKITLVLVAMLLVFLSGCVRDVAPVQCWSYSVIQPYGYVMYNTCTGDVRDGVLPVAREIFDRMMTLQGSNGTK